MTLTQDNEYAVILDACVLVPMPLCDTLLRLAEEPAIYRPLWSEKILEEVGKALEQKLNRSPFQRERRICAMRGAFPEAEVFYPSDLIQAMSCIPDPEDRHVLAAAISGSAQAIVTFNTKHFPSDCVGQYGIVRQTPDEFLIHQFRLSSEHVLQKLDNQAAAHGRERSSLLQSLQKLVPSFVALIELGIFETDDETAREDSPS